MADQNITLDEMAIGFLVAGVDGNTTADTLIEAIETLRKVRSAVALVAELHGADLDSTLHAAESAAIIAEATEYIRTGLEVTR